MDFSDQAILAAEKGYYRLIKSIEILPMVEIGKESTLDILAWRDKCYEAMDDDFNTPILISHLFEGVNFINQLKEKSETLTEGDLDLFIKVMSDFVYDVLGMGRNLIPHGAHGDKLDGTIKLLIEMRNTARSDRNYLLSDQIRNRLALLNIHLEDGKTGTKFKY